MAQSNNPVCSHSSSSSSSSSSYLCSFSSISNICLHLSLDSSYSCCKTTKLTTKRKRVQQETTFSRNKNKNNVCFHLSLGSCCPSCKTTFTNDDKQVVPMKKQKRVHQETNVSKKITCNDVGRNWNIKKVLEHSDIDGQQNRLLLNKELAQEFVIPVLDAEAVENGVRVEILDVDTNSLHSLVFKIWRSTQSHVFKKKWFKDFVCRRSLKKGDQIGLNWDENNKRFDFSVLPSNQDTQNN